MLCFSTCIEKSHIRESVGESLSVALTGAVVSAGVCVARLFSVCHSQLGC